MDIWLLRQMNIGGDQPCLQTARSFPMSMQYNKRRWLGKAGAAVQRSPVYVSLR